MNKQKDLLHDASLLRPTGRIEALECLRGIAALVVIFWHLMLAFEPRHSGIFDERATFILTGRPWSGFINGTAAVSFFFVLSGFVLPWAYFHKADLGIIVRGLIKRWPRLALTCMVVVLGSWFLFVTHAYFYADAAAISGSPWLKGFAFANLPSDFAPSFWVALKQGAINAFFSDDLSDVSYDTTLWSMHPEFLGSLITLSLAPILFYIQRSLIIIGLAMTLGFALLPLNTHIPEFLAGMVLARFMSQHLITIPTNRAFMMILCACILFGYRGSFGFFNAFGHLGINADVRYPWVWTPASLLLIAAIVGCASINKALSGKAARFLGRVSFPIYLLHAPIICSVGSWLYTCASLASLSPKICVALAVTGVLSTTFMLAVPLGLLDQWWVRQTNTVVAHIIKKPSVRS